MGFLLALSVPACKPADQTAEKPAALPMPGARAAAGEIPGMAEALEKRYPGDKAKQEDARDGMRKLDAKLAAQVQLAAANRRTMVAAAPSDFKPELSDRKIRLRLAVEKPRLKAGERLRVRLEVTNVGRKPIEYAETRSSFFVKDGGLLDSPTLRFFLTDARNKKRELLPPTVSSPPLAGGKSKSESIPPGMTQAEKERWFEDAAAMGQAHATFNVKLLPGETLGSAGDDASSFKTLNTEAPFDKPGVYRLSVELDDRPAPLEKDYIEYSLKSGSTLKEIRKWHDEYARAALGPVSAVTTFEVTQ